MRTAARRVQPTTDERVELEAVNIRYAGPSRDLHTNVWTWTCAHCGFDGNEKIDTMYRRYSTACRRCNGTNTFDFTKYGA